MDVLIHVNLAISMLVTNIGDVNIAPTAKISDLDLNSVTNIEKFSPTSQGHRHHTVTNITVMLLELCVR